MAGAGYKLFNTGDVLTAAQVNTYLQEQVVMVFASAAARTTALSGVLAEGMVSYLKDTDALEIYSGSAWVGYGSGDITGVTAGTGISGGGTSGSVTITNSMATEITAAGDIIVGTGSGTFDNLPIGTTGQVLTADTTVSPYKVKWATASSSSGPLFQATRDSSNQTLTLNTNTKLQFNSEIYDTGSCYDPTTNYRFTPTTAGYYAVDLNAWIDNGASGDVYLRVYKNGSEFMTVSGTKQDNETSGGSCIVYLNGSTDYIEAYGYSTVSGATLRNGNTRSNFGASWIRS